MRSSIEGRSNAGGGAGMTVMGEVADGCSSVSIVSGAGAAGGAEDREDPCMNSGRGCGVDVEVGVRRSVAPVVRFWRGRGGRQSAGGAPIVSDGSGGTRSCVCAMVDVGWIGPLDGPVHEDEG